MMLRGAFLASTLMISTMLPAAAEGDNVVLVAVNKVDVPRRLPGLCRLNASVSQVWEGMAFHAGQLLVISVPCSAGNSFAAPANLVRGQGAHFFAVDVLQKSRQGFARLDDSGALIWEPSRRFYGPWGVADGYRVMDGALLPVPENSKS